MGGGRWARVIIEVLLDILDPNINISIYSPNNHSFMKEWIIKKNNFKHKIKVIKRFPNSFSNSCAVIVANAARDHYNSSIMALKAGADVLVEKPITLSYKQAKKIDDLAKKQNKIICASHVFLFASYIDNLSKLLQVNGKIEKMKIKWEDSVIEKRHGELKKFDAGLPIIADCLPHIFSIISKFISIDIPYDSIQLQIDHGGSKVKMKAESSGVPIEICLIRNGFKRVRLIETLVGGKNNKLDFSTEPGEIEIENKKMSGDFDWGIEPKPLKQLLLAFLLGVNSRKFDERLDFRFGIQISKLIDKFLKIYKDSQIDWIINSLKKVDYLNQDLNYAINEFNLFYELDINLKSDQNKLSAETKNKLLSKFNQLLLQNKD